MKYSSAPKVYIVGVGPGGKEYITPRALCAIEQSDLILGWDLDIAPVKDLLQGKSILLQNVNNFSAVAKKAVILARRRKATLAVLRIGDPCVSSGLAEMMEILEGIEVETIPGISSVQLAAAIAGVNIDDSVVVSFHDYGDPEAEKTFMLNSFKAGKHVIMLVSPDLRPNEAADYLIRHGVNELTPAYVCSNLSLPNEKIVRASLREIRAIDNFYWLSLMVVINPVLPSPGENKRIWEKWRRSRVKIEASSS